MSNFLGFESFLIALGADVATMQTTIDAALTSRGWQKKRRSLVPIAVGGTMATPSNAFDFDFLTYAGTQGAAGSVAVQTAGFTPTLLTICSGSNSPQTYAPKAFTLEWSDTSLTTGFTVHQSFNETQWSLEEIKRYVITGAPSKPYWRINTTTQQSGASGGGYLSLVALEDAGGQVITNQVFSDFIPPVGETIGNATARDILRIEYGSTYIRFVAFQESLVFTPQVISLWDKTAGAVACGVTLDGVTVTGATGGAGNTSRQNLRLLYEAIKASGASPFTNFNWEYQYLSPQNPSGTNDYILGVAKTNVPNCIVTPNANTNGQITGNNTLPGIGWMCARSTNTDVTVDLVNGFIYYIQVNSRGIGLGTKTNSNFYGPIHACFGDNAKAVAAVPSSGWSIPCTPIELVVGWDEDTTKTGALGKVSHAYGIDEATFAKAQGLTGTYEGGHPFNRCSPRLKIIDAQGPMPSQSWALSGIPLYGSNLFSAADVTGNDFQIHRVSMIGEYMSSIANAGVNSMRAVSPCVDIQDWYKFVGTATDEALMLVADTVATTTESGAVSAAAVDIPVASTAGFQSAGFIVIESEIIQYTSLATGPVRFSGCTRGKYGTTAAAHFDQDLVCQGLWFVKLNNGALFCGYQKPT
jgi:hypothetical protein